MIVPMDAALPITIATIYNDTPISDIFANVILYVEVLHIFGKAYSCNGHQKRSSKMLLTVRPRNKTEKQQEGMRIEVSFAAYKMGTLLR